MKKIILDENLPVALRHHLSECEVVTIRYQGWSGIQNGELIRLIDGSFDILLTADRNLRYQQNLTNRQIAIILVPFTRLDSLLPILNKIQQAIHEIQVGEYLEIE